MNSGDAKVWLTTGTCVRAAGSSKRRKSRAARTKSRSTRSVRRAKKSKRTSARNRPRGSKKKIDWGSRLYRWQEQQAKKEGREYYEIDERAYPYFAQYQKWIGTHKQEQGEGR